MSASCPRLADTRRLVGERLKDTISAAENRELKAHVSDCAACRAEALRLDSTLLFSPLAGEPPSRRDDSEARRLSRDILAAIEMERARRRVASPARSVLLRAASIAILAAGLGTILHLARRQDDAPLVVVIAPTPVPQRGSTPVLIDQVGNPGATIYQFASTSATEPNVVFVVDRNADI